jgi:hypothetical protein
MPDGNTFGNIRNPKDSLETVLRTSVRGVRRRARCHIGAATAAAKYWRVMSGRSGLVFWKQLSRAFEHLGSLLDDRVEEASVTRQGFSMRRRVESGLENAKKELPAPETRELIAEVVEKTSPFLQETYELAQINPSASVAAAAARLEVALRSVLMQKNPAAAQQLTLGRLIREAAKQGVLTEDEASAAGYLVQVRNEAVHAGGASRDQAMEFAYLALRIATGARLAVGEVNSDGTDPL